MKSYVSLFTILLVTACASVPKDATLRQPASELGTDQTRHFTGVTGVELFQSCVDDEVVGKTVILVRMILLGFVRLAQQIWMDAHSR